MKYSLKEQAAMFRCTVDQIRAQHRVNAADSRKCAAKAEASVKGKYSGKTAAQWLEWANRSETIANLPE